MPIILSSVLLQHSHLVLQVFEFPLPLLSLHFDFLSHHLCLGFGSLRVLQLFDHASFVGLPLLHVLVHSMPQNQIVLRLLLFVLVLDYLFFCLFFTSWVVNLALVSEIDFKQSFLKMILSSVVLLPVSFLSDLSTKVSEVSRLLLLLSHVLILFDLQELLGWQWHVIMGGRGV